MDRTDIKQFPDDAKDMGPAFFGRNEFLYLVAEKNDPDLIVIGNSRKSQHSAEFRYQLVLHPGDRPEKRRLAYIHQEHDRQFPFLLKYLHKRVVKPGRHIPVNGADVITVLVF